MKEYNFIQTKLTSDEICENYTQNEFTFYELYVLKKIWDNLADKSNQDKINRGINIDIFNSFTNIDGLLGLRLFEIFDTKSNKYIDFEDFINGLRIICIGTTSSQSDFLFKIFDINKLGKIEQKFMKSIINSIPHKFICKCSHNHYISDEKFNYEIWTNNCICSNAFNKFDKNHDKYLDHVEFEKWFEINNIVINYIKNKINFYVQTDIKRQKLISKTNILLKPSEISENKYESFMWKKGKNFYFKIKRYFLLYGNCLYYYKFKSDIKPIKVIFLSGSIINPVGNNLIEILELNKCTGEHNLNNKKIFECKNTEIRNEWVRRLQISSHVIPFESVYKLKEKIADGGFSCVHKCEKIVCSDYDCDVNEKGNSTEFAVKIISKENMREIDKENIKNEISILKLISHPNIIHLHGFYENKKNIYFVVEFIKDGDLFDYINKRQLFTDNELKKLAKTMAECLAYLHELGIIHRDIKPENILYDTTKDKLILTDFGLSKIVFPDYKLSDNSGTIDYIAPEIIKFESCGIEVDLWSLGCTLYLVYYGFLPFTDIFDVDIINNIISKKPEYSNKKNKDANDLISKLLEKDPKKRISAKEMLLHPFIAFE